MLNLEHYHPKNYVPNIIIQYKSPGTSNTERQILNVKIRNANILNGIRTVLRRTFPR